ncbi:MAG: tetratricopeptide repeat protein, partial [Devosia sp.]|nr:tetratricopeptide repeat protein [Devosia sp.]
GHGIEAKGENYLAPTDTDLTTPQTAGDSLVPVGPMLEALSKAAPVTIVLLDACRSDPFPPGQMIVLPGDTQPVPIETQGLAAVRGPTPLARPDADPDSLGAVIGFAAEPGAPALDGAPGENSPYAAALLKHLAAGGYSFGDVMTMVTEEVYLKTRAKQLPWTNSSLRRVLAFAAPEEQSEDKDQVAIKTERRKLLLSIAGTPAQTRTYVETLAGEEAVPLDALYGMLNVLGIKASDGGDDLEQQLQKGAERLKQLMADKTATVKADPELERLSKLAEDAEAEGAIALALQYRDDASKRADALLTDRQAEANRLKQDMIDIAQTYADNAATAALNFDHAHAAELYAKAYGAVQDWDAAKALDYKINQGDALTDRGYYTTDNDALTASLAAYQDALVLAPKDRAPLDWARIQDRIGQTMQTLGERIEDTTTLEKSIGYYEAALTVRTEANDPTEWAKSQNNLGNALFTLGARTGDLDLLAKSIPPFDAALRILTPEAEPLRWTTVANNRAASLVQIAQATYDATSGAEMAAMMAGEADPGSVPVVKQAKDKATAMLDEAVEATQSAIASTSRAGNPFGWAMLQHTRATALQQRGEMNHVADDLRQAADAYRVVLEVHTKEQTPAQWARTSNNLAIALKKLSDETDDPVPLKEAIDIYRAVIELTPRANLPLDWADRQESLGNALAMLSQYEGTTAPLAEALAAYELANEVTTLDRGARKWEQLQTSMSTTLLMQGLMSFDKVSVERAKELALRTRDKLREIGQPDEAFFDAYLPQIDKVLDLFPK